MTKTQVENLKWYIISGLLIPLLTWMVVMIYSTKESTSVIQSDVQHQKEISEKIYSNLDHKLDIELYEVRHSELIKDVDEVKAKVDKITKNMNLTFDEHNAKSKISHQNIMYAVDTVRYKVDSLYTYTVLHLVNGNYFPEKQIMTESVTWDIFNKKK